MPDTIVDLGPGKPPLIISLNGSRSTFTIEADRIEATMLAPLDPLLEDLLDIACSVFAADGQIKRGGPTRPAMGEDWRRTFNFDIPVRCPDIWTRPDVVEALTDAVSFLTDDNYTFRFRGAEGFRQGQSFLNLDPEASAFTADEVILFSGGLDSFAGALEALETRRGRVVLVTHRSAQKAIPRQVRLGKFLAKQFPGRVLHIHIRATRAGSASTETTQRSRSFLFAVLGQVFARMVGAHQVSFYENGVVSQNLPISPQVIGTMATRTTHPLGLRLMGDLMALIDPVAVPIHNPFVWLTKTEVVRRIVDHHAVGQIKDSVSCTSIRDQDTLHTHCGSCSQCFDRRFAILANDLKDHDPEEMYRIEVLTGSRDSDRSRTMALDWSRHALSLKDISLRDYMQRFGHELMRVIRGHPDIAQNDALQNCLALHHRHAAAVLKAFEAAFALNAGALARGDLPPTSLSRLHAGSGSAEMPPLKFLTAVPQTAHPMNNVAAEPETDLVPELDKPLEVAFLHDDGVPLIVITGIGRYRGANARIAHALKAPFDEDRAANCGRDDYRYRASGELAEEIKISKPVVEQRVKRLRASIADDFARVFGIPPTAPLLIQTRKPKGYRLDPDLRIAKD